MLKNILLILFKKIRKEELEIGDFSNHEILIIFLDRTIKLLRGFFLINIMLNTKGLFFVGKNTTLKGIKKLSFTTGTTIGSNCKISAIGSKKFNFGKNFTLKDFSIIDSFGSIKMEGGSLMIGNNVGISEYCYLGIKGNVIIGNDVIIGPGVKIFSENHSIKLNGIPFRLQKEKRSLTVIGDNVWIGANSIILSGVKINSNIVIAAGSVVTKDLKTESIFGGIPAKFIKNL